MATTKDEARQLAWRLWTVAPDYTWLVGPNLRSAFSGLAAALWLLGLTGMGVVDRGSVPPRAQAYVLGGDAALWDSIPAPAARPGEVPAVEALGTTGRGLAIVSVHAESCGIEERADGRRIWAHLAGDGVEHQIRPPVVAFRDVKTPTTPEPGALPADWATVRMLRCPVQLGLCVDQRLDNLIRELQLIDSDDGPTPPRELGQLIEQLVTRPAFARHMGRRIALDAAAAGLDATAAGLDATAAGLEHVDIEMTLPHEMAASVRELLAADNLADEICETHHLLPRRVQRSGREMAMA